jgi:hypothetical protein
MSLFRVLGLALFVVGVFLLVLGLRATNSVGESLTEGITGKYTDQTTWYIVGGAAALVVGAGLTIFGGGSRR